MCHLWLRWLGDLPYGTCRLLLLPCIDKEAYSKDDERDAEDLTHVEQHGFLELHLRLLDEFDDESHSEAHNEEYADESAAIDLIQLLDVQPQNE